MAQTIHPKTLLKDPGHLLSLGFGSGLSPFAPGTAGTLVAIPIYYLAISFTTPVWYAILTLAVTVLGIYLCDRTTRALGVHDHPAIVWDEVAGYLITMLFVPFSLTTVIVGFVLFRLFDILKPWPVSVIDTRMKGGLGVMLDDVIAGLYALMCLHLYVRFIS